STDLSFGALEVALLEEYASRKKMSQRIFIAYASGQGQCFIAKGFLINKRHDEEVPRGTSNPIQIHGAAGGLLSSVELLQKSVADRQVDEQRRKMGIEFDRCIQLLHR